MHDTDLPPTRTAAGRAVALTCLIAVLGVAAGLAAGLVWAAIAPRVVYQVASLHPPTAYAVNPETSAFIAADGCYCLLAVIGGALVGGAGYLIGIRRHGPLPMAGIVAGSTAAAFASAWLGHRQSGAPGFSALLRAPIMLGSHGAMAFWPLAAAAVVGAIELVRVLRSRQRAVEAAPGFGLTAGNGAGPYPYPAGPYPAGPYLAAGPLPNGQSAGPVPGGQGPSPAVWPFPPPPRPEPDQPAPPRAEP
jgi:hypothetical protein